MSCPSQASLLVHESDPMSSSTINLTDKRMDEGKSVLLQIFCCMRKKLLQASDSNQFPVRYAGCVLTSQACLLQWHHWFGWVHSSRCTRGA